MFYAYKVNVKYSFSRHINEEQYNNFILKSALDTAPLVALEIILLKEV